MCGGLHLVRERVDVEFVEPSLGGRQSRSFGGFRLHSPPPPPRPLRCACCPCFVACQLCAMALFVGRVCALLLFLACSRNGLGLSYSDLERYRYEHSSSSLVPLFDIQFKDDLPVRTKRYLPDMEEDDLSSYRSSLTQSLEENPKKAGGISESKVGNISEISDATSNSTLVPHIIKIPVAYNKSESKTGGNYKSINDTATKSVLDTNISTLLKPTTTPAVESTTASLNITKENSSEAATNVSQDLNSTTLPPIFDPVNKTLTDHNITSRNEDHHMYYNSSVYSDENIGHYYWFNMDNYSEVQTNEMLSQSHRRAATVKLSFNFPFYGHIVTNVTIATGGFLYTGEFVHSWLAATQYVAPLMANFDTSLSNDSYIKYMDNGTQFTVQWDKVRLQDKPDSGDFTFQATLRDNGDIIFVYQSVPMNIDNITDEKHPVKVGLSDAYIIDRTILFVRRKTIFEYHRVTFEHIEIKNWTVIYLSALPTCMNGTTCNSCLTHDTGFDCYWCPAINRCSNGIDRHRHAWLANDCDAHSFTNVSQCTDFEITTEKTTTTTQPIVIGHEAQVGHKETTEDIFSDDTSSFNVSALLGIMFFIGLVMTISLWILYAYRNPHTTSGQFLIKYRPSQWSWKRGEARYTAATIHM